MAVASVVMEGPMAKGQKRTSKEVRKPKQDKPKPAPAGSGAKG